MFLTVMLLPVLASAQSSITGVVRDSCGGVLPGVTVEVSSPAQLDSLPIGESLRALRGLSVGAVYTGGRVERLGVRVSF
jgi:hypothetical protein